MGRKLIERGKLGIKCSFLEILQKQKIRLCILIHNEAILAKDVPRT